MLYDDILNKLYKDKKNIPFITYLILNDVDINVFEYYLKNNIRQINKIYKNPLYQPLIASIDKKLNTSYFDLLIKYGANVNLIIDNKPILYYYFKTLYRNIYYLEQLIKNNVDINSVFSNKLLLKSIMCEIYTIEINYICKFNKHYIYLLISEYIEKHHIKSFVFIQSLFNDKILNEYMLSNILIQYIIYNVIQSIVEVNKLNGQINYYSILKSNAKLIYINNIIEYYLTSDKFKLYFEKGILSLDNIMYNLDNYININKYNGLPLIYILYDIINKNLDKYSPFDYLIYFLPKKLLLLLLKYNNINYNVVDNHNLLYVFLTSAFTSNKITEHLHDIYVILNSKLNLYNETSDIAININNMLFELILNNDFDKDEFIRLFLNNLITSRPQHLIQKAINKYNLKLDEYTYTIQYKFNNIEDNINVSLIHAAALNTNYVFKYILYLYPTLNINNNINKYKLTPLHCAILHHNFIVINTILNIKQVNLSLLDIFNNTYLNFYILNYYTSHKVNNNDYIEQLFIILNKSCNIEICNIYGNNALISALSINEQEIIDLFESNIFNLSIIKYIQINFDKL